MKDFLRRIYHKIELESIKRIYRKAIPAPIRKILWRLRYYFVNPINIIGLTKVKGIYRDQKRFMADILEYYNSDETLPDDYSKTVIFMADGRKPTGGWADRLRAIVSIFKLCKELGIVFKINFTSPFDLKDFLLPNLYDWTILPEEICYNNKLSKPVYILAYLDKFHDAEAQKFWAIKFIKENNKQIHFYSNMNTVGKEYGALFYELFKPTIELKNLIDYNLGRLGGRGEFISVVFRFEQLLGDFKEPYYPDVGLYHLILPDDKRKILINKCIEHLKKIHNENGGEKILVTSDSMSFLAEAKKLPFVYVIPGEVLHIDAHQNTGKEANLKLFLDYFVLSCSKKVYLVVEYQMYRHSGFSCSAALLNNVPFIIRG
jgi:hypothetical protein